MAGGYMGKTLRVDLTSGSIRDEKLPEASILKKLIGGQALALTSPISLGLEEFMEWSQPDEGGTRG